MKKWAKSSEGLVRTFESALPDDPAAERRKMFGYPCSFVNGNMFAGLHEERMVLRLPDEPRGEFLAIAGASIFEPMPGRVMREYVVVPAKVLNDVRLLRSWTLRAFEYAASLPAKTKKPAKAASKKKAPKAKRKTKKA